MSKLGALKMREQRRYNNFTWTAFPMPEEPEPVVVVRYDKCTEEQARVSCGLALFFLKLNPPANWYQYCVEQSCSFPSGSYRYTFWWTLRVWGPDNEYLSEEGWAGWEQDFAWKLDQFRSGVCRGMQKEYPW